MSIPKWFQPLVESVCDSCICEVKGRMTGFSIYWSRPSDNGWGVWLVDVTPLPSSLLEGQMMEKRSSTPSM